MFRQFAIELLMPKALVVASMSDLGADRKKIAEAFQVSEEAAGMRIKALWETL